MKRRRNLPQSGVGSVSLPQLAPMRSAVRAIPARPNYSRWRAGVLIGIHVLFAIHIVHWRLAGRTLAPLELNEVMYTLELGIVTAAFVLMALIVLSVAIFGRFFCSWGCHILALQDLCAWILRKLHIRAKPVRSRVLLLVGPLAMLYMFVWPQVQRLIEQRALPQLHLLDDTAGWASFVTDDFWRNLPGPGMAILTFVICGFVIVYVLGTRSFCQYACPYGAIFGIMDRFAPGRIKLVADTCTSCGICTSVCESHVRVHEEIAEHRRVIDSACLKDLDCVSACPEGALAYGWTRPSLWESLRPARRRIPYDFSFVEDVLMVAVFLAALATFRGLYGSVPFLLTLAIGGILAYLAVLTVRMLTSANVRLNRFQLKLKGARTRQGTTFMALAAIIFGFAIHCGIIRYHEAAGQRALSMATSQFQNGEDTALVAAAARTAYQHFSFCDHWGLMTPHGQDACMASAAWAKGDLKEAESRWQRAIKQSPADYESRFYLSSLLLEQGQSDRAEAMLREITMAREHSTKDAARYARYRASAWMRLGSEAMGRGDLTKADAAFISASSELPTDAALHMAIAETRAALDDMEGAAAQLKLVIQLDPQNAAAHFNLGVLEGDLGRFQSAVKHYQHAAELSPNDADIWNNLAYAHQQLGELEEAHRCLERALSTKDNSDNAQRQTSKEEAESAIADSP